VVVKFDPQPKSFIQSGSMKFCVWKLNDYPAKTGIFPGPDSTAVIRSIQVVEREDMQWVIRFHHPNHRWSANTSLAFGWPQSSVMLSRGLPSRWMCRLHTLSVIFWCKPSRIIRRRN